MITAAVHKFLRDKRIARLATVDAEGYPHVVPLWYGVDGDDLVIMTDRDTRKVKNALHNPHGAIQIGGEIGDYDGGYLFQGEVFVEDDADKRWTAAITRRYETPERADALLDEWKDDDVVVIRLRVKRVVKVA